MPPQASVFFNRTAASGGRIDEFIQELITPTARATVLATAGAALAIALSAGKAVATGLSGAMPAQIVLEAAAIDTILVYSVAARTIVICTYAEPKESEADWAHATVVASGLTLPILQADPSLATPAQEFARAKSRLVGAETLDPARFARMADTLRAPAGAGGLGRNGARLSLNRSDAAQSYEETPLDQQLSALALHPKARRMLGFGHHDQAGLVPRHSYRYRVVGRFEAADSAVDAAGRISGTETLSNVARLEKHTPPPLPAGPQPAPGWTPTGIWRDQRGHGRGRSWRGRRD